MGGGIFVGLILGMGLYEGQQYNDKISFGNKILLLKQWRVAAVDMDKEHFRDGCMTANMTQVLNYLSFLLKNGSNTSIKFHIKVDS